MKSFACPYKTPTKKNKGMYSPVELFMLYVAPSFTPAKSFVDITSELPLSYRLSETKLIKVHH